jgi:hypothetical protein
VPFFPFSFPFAWPGDLPTYAPGDTPTFGDLVYVDDHSDEATALLLEQFHDLPLIDGMVRSYINRIQELEDQIWQILLATDLDVAVGAQLDGLGDIVGEPRRARSNDAYRAAIRVRIMINRCDGKHATMLRILTTYLGIASGAGTVELREPAAAALALNVYTVPESFADLSVIANTIKPAGVNLDARAETSLSRPYRFGWSGGAVAGVSGATNGDGWSGDASVGGLHAVRI